MSFPSGYSAETGPFFTAGGEELDLEDTLPYLLVRLRILNSLTA